MFAFVFRSGFGTLLLLGLIRPTTHEINQLFERNIFAVEVVLGDDLIDVFLCLLTEAVVPDVNFDNVLVALQGVLQSSSV